MFLLVHYYDTSTLFFRCHFCETLPPLRGQTTHGTLYCATPDPNPPGTLHILCHTRRQPTWHTTYAVPHQTPAHLAHYICCATPDANPPGSLPVDPPSWTDVLELTEPLRPQTDKVCTVLCTSVHSTVPRSISCCLACSTCPCSLVPPFAIISYQ